MHHVVGYVTLTFNVFGTHMLTVFAVCLVDLARSGDLRSEQPSEEATSSAATAGYSHGSSSSSNTAICFAPKSSDNSDGSRTHTYDLRKRKPALPAAAVAVPQSKTSAGPSGSSAAVTDCSSSAGVTHLSSTSPLLTFAFLFCLRAALTAVNVSLQRRHLMVWAIFAPKYVFDAVAMVVVQTVAWCAHVVGAHN